MQVKEILRVKGNRLLCIEPVGPRRRRGAHHGEGEPRLAGGAGAGPHGRHAHLPRAAARARRARRLARRPARSAKSWTRDPVTATPDMEVNDLRRTMLESGARYLPVMQDGKLLGVISFRDVAKAVLEEQDFENKMLKGYIKNWLV